LDHVNLIALPGDTYEVCEWFHWGEVRVGDNLPGTTISLQADIIAQGVFNNEALSNILEMYVIPESGAMIVWSLLAALGIGCGWYQRKHQLGQ